MIKKLGLLLALLITSLGWTQGAFANSNSYAAAGGYPSCYKGYGVGDPLYNGTNGDRWAVTGWCVDKNGVLTPQTGITVNSTQPVSQGGFAVPVLNYNVGTNPGGVAIPATTFDTLLAQQTGSTIVDYGGYSITATIDTLKGSGGHYVLPPAMPGEIFTIVSASQSVITVDTLTSAFATGEGFTYANADTIEWSPNATGMTAGQSIKSPGNAGAMVTLISNVAGQWQITNMQGQIGATATSDSLWTVISTQ